MTEIESLVTTKAQLEAENQRLRREIAALHRVAAENGRLRMVVHNLHQQNTALTLKVTRRELAEVLAKAKSDHLEDSTTDLDKVEVAVAAGAKKAQDPNYRRVG